MVFSVALFLVLFPMKIVIGFRTHPHSGWSRLEIPRHLQRPLFQLRRHSKVWGWDIFFFFLFGGGTPVNPLQRQHYVGLCPWQVGYIGNLIHLFLEVEKIPVPFGKRWNSAGPAGRLTNYWSGYLDGSDPGCWSIWWPEWQVVLDCCPKIPNGLGWWLELEIKGRGLHKAKT